MRCFDRLHRLILMRRSSKPWHMVTVTVCCLLPLAAAVVAGVLAGKRRRTGR